MRRTDAWNLLVSNCLSYHGIKHTVEECFISVDRTSMVRMSSGLTENDAYEWVMTLLRELCGEDRYVCWSDHPDEWLGVEIYEKDPW